MESYLMMLYVTLEQESALKNFFIEHGWAFCKPDLSVVTDKLGPVTTRLSVASEEIDVNDTHSQQTEQNKKEQETQKLKVKIPASSENTGKQRGKRKTCSQRQPIKFPKQAKVVPSTSVTEPDESDKPEETAEQEEMTELNEVAEEQKKDTNPTKRKVIVEMGDGRQIQIKIERERRDMVESEGVGERQDKGEQEAGMIDDAEGESSDGDDAQTDGENAGDAVVKSEIETAGESSISRMELTVDDAAPKHKKKTREKCNRQYEMSQLLKAYNSVVETGAQINRAAKMFDVPVSTLRDRVHNKVSFDVTRASPRPVLNREEETKFISHLIRLAKIGYGYTQVEVTRQASDFAIELGKRDAAKSFSAKWHANYFARYSDENCVKTFTLQQQRSFCKREECISAYYNNLNNIAKENKLTQAPERIYLLDEIEVDIPAGEKCNNTLTVIGAGNAAGQNIPPYSVWVTGYSGDNDHYFVRRSHLIGHGFKTYFQSHFAKYVSRKDENEHILVLYDAHRVPFSVEVIEWAKRSQIVLFPIPPYTSRSCKTSFNTVFQQIETKFSQEYSDAAPYKHLASATNFVDILKDIYESSVTPSALKERFSKCGIYPLQESKIMCDFLKKEGIISLS